MNKTLTTLLLAASLTTFPALAEDGFDFMGGNVAQVEKVAKAPREANGHSNGINLKEGAIAFGLGGLGPLGAIALPFVGVSAAKRAAVEMNSFYSGAVVRGKVTKIYDKVDFPGWGKSWGLDLNTAPTSGEGRGEFAVLQLDVDGPTDSERYILVRKDVGYEIGDIVDAKTLVGTYAFQPKVNKDVKLDFNKHMPRVIALYCKHDQPCQNDYESSLGVLYRHQDKDFPVSQYLIDPAIIAADQAKMRKEAEETKTASNSGSFSFF